MQSYRGSRSHIQREGKTEEKCESSHIKRASQYDFNEAHFLARGKPARDASCPSCLLDPVMSFISCIRSGMGLTKLNLVPQAQKPPGSKRLLVVRHDSNNYVDDNIWDNDY